MSKVWFITGAARGMGKSIADDYVVATTRKADDFIMPEGCAADYAGTTKRPHH